MSQTPFVPSRHGFPFINSFPHGTPVIEVPTPFGRVPLGDAAGGLCGGMVFAALDLFRDGRTPPSDSENIIPYLCRRLLDSWNFPFGVLTYYDWQMRPNASRFAFGQRVQMGVRALTIEREWPKIEAMLNTGHPAPLGVVNSHSYSPCQLSRNHQVLAIGYQIRNTEVQIQIYDPNHPCIDDVYLIIDLRDPDTGGEIVHTHEDRRVRGVFLTEYRAPLQPAI